MRRAVGVYMLVVQEQFGMAVEVLGMSVSVLGSVLRSRRDLGTDLGGRCR